MPATILSSVESRANTLSQRPLAASVWMMSACLMFSCMNALIHALGERIHPFVIVFFRNFFGLAFLVPFLLRQGMGILVTNRRSFGLYSLRSVLGFSAMLCSFYALSVAPLAQITALSFTLPLFATVMAALFLGEVVRLRRWTATLAGFVGILVIVRPGSEGLSLGAGLAILSSVISAWVTIIIKRLSATEPNLVIVIYMVLIITPLSLVPAWFFWQWPSWGDLGLLAVLGALGSVGHICFVRSFTYADASAVMPLDYTRMIFAAGMGYFFFNEIPDDYTWLGTGIIVSAALYIAHREAQLKRRASLNVPAST